MNTTQGLLKKGLGHVILSKAKNLLRFAKYGDTAAGSAGILPAVARASSPRVCWGGTPQQLRPGPISVPINSIGTSDSRYRRRSRYIVGSPYFARLSKGRLDIVEES